MYPQTAALQRLVEHKLPTVFGPESTYFGRDAHATRRLVTKTMDATLYTLYGEYGAGVETALASALSDITTTVAGEGFFVGPVVVQQDGPANISIRVFWCEVDADFPII